MTKLQIAGWILSGVLSAFLIFGSAAGKFTDWEGKAEMLEQLGFSSDVMWNIGVVEVICAVLFLIPKTSFVGAILLTGYLGGATATHVRIGDPFMAPVITGIVVWGALGLRQADIFRLALGGNRHASQIE